MTQLALRECHRFEAAGQTYLYLVPSAAVFGLHGPSQAVIDVLEAGPRPVADLVAELGERFTPADIRSSIDELAGAQAIGRVAPPPVPVKPAPNIIPLTPCRRSSSTSPISAT